MEVHGGVEHCEELGLVTAHSYGEAVNDDEPAQSFRHRTAEHSRNATDARQRKWCQSRMSLEQWSNFRALPEISATSIPSGSKPTGGVLLSARDSGRRTKFTNLSRGSDPEMESSGSC